MLTSVNTERFDALVACVTLVEVELQGEGLRFNASGGPMLSSCLTPVKFEVKYR